MDLSGVYDARSGRLVCESRVAWLKDNGWLNWRNRYAPPDEISVGMNIHLKLSDNGTQCTPTWMPN